MSSEQTPQKQAKPEHPRLKVLALCSLSIVIVSGILYWGTVLTAGLEPKAARQETSEDPKLDPATPSESTPEKEPLIAFPEAEDAVPYQEAGPVEPLPPDAMAWTEFVARPSMWPERLSITIDQKIPVRYRDNNHGELIFSPGQTLDVFELNADGRILGSINGNTFYLPVTATDLKTWFVGKHGEYDILAMPDAAMPVKTATKLSDEKKSELITRLRVWTLSNYDSHAIEIGEDNLIFRWTPQEEAEINFRVEAREIARKYLMLCSELGRADNYASCEIYDRSSGEFLGSNGIFILSL